MFNQMAAAQVIDSPGAMVRELIENALDAGATHIALEFWPEAGRLQLADNGVGMSQANLVLAAAAHSTSKIYNAADLWQIRTLGFRGQALHSLAQLGRLSLCSRLRSSTSGWQVTYSSQGEPSQINPIAMAPGTIVTVAELFYLWPDRRQQEAGQLRQVQQVIYHAALCHPQVTWRARLSDRPWFSLTPGPSARSVLTQILPMVNPLDLKETDGESPWSGPLRGKQSALEGDCYGLIGLPDRCHRPRPDWVKVALNGRIVTLPELNQKLIQSFRHTLPRHRYPLGFVHLRLAPGDIDWHRSPDKSRIYLQNLELWGEKIQTTVQSLIADHSSDDSGARRSFSNWIKTTEPGGLYQASPQQHASRPSLIAIAQVHNRYILAEQPDGLCLIEQHIAHERVIYEQLQDCWQIVPLATPLVLDSLSPDQVQQLQQLGLAIEEFGPQRWIIRSAPASLVDQPDLEAALLDISRGGAGDGARVAIACRTAIRNGTPLSLPAMQNLVTDWQRTRQPRTCPHGRPICLTLKESSLASFFKRHWVIGKSHGI
ncbi:MAG: DNA mismatch repair endonuclease MutL [Cyanobacteria bacterium REEB459]|nr:DNA mismatch repair endonuclease MutL [Cyanobacteria bacterium REEB459]